MSVVAGSSVAVIETSSAASIACSRLSATTTATASPANRILSPVRGYRTGILMSSVIGQTNGSPPISRSAAVKTPTTPGIAAASAVSIPSIVAWTYGGRTSAIHTMPGIVQLSMYCASPVMSSGSSLRRTGRPTNDSVATMTVLPSGLRAAHLAGGIQDRLDDVLVTGAPAEVPLEGLAHLRLRRRRVLLQVARGRHQHARRAVPALQAVVPMEGVLQRVQGPVGAGQSFDRRDLAAVRLDGQERAGLHRLAAKLDGHTPGPAESPPLGPTLTVGGAVEAPATKGSGGWAGGSGATPAAPRSPRPSAPRASARARSAASLA